MKIFYWVLFLVLHSFPQTYLTGELKGPYPRDDYIVSGNLYVNPGDTLVFAAGSRLLFEPFTGIIVRGTFIANGEKNWPVIFTTSKDQGVSSGAVTTISSFDWNGIQAPDSMAHIRMSYCQICYGTIGMEIKDERADVILNGISFHKNGYMNLKRGEKLFKVNDDTEYDFGWTRQGGEVLTHGPARQSSSKKNSSSKTGSEGSRKINWRLPLRIALGATALCGTGLWINSQINADKYNKAYQEGQDLISVNDAREKRDEMVKRRTMGVLLCFAGAAGFTLTFLF